MEETPDGETKTGSLIIHLLPLPYQHIQKTSWDTQPHRTEQLLGSQTFHLQLVNVRLKPY